MIKRFIIEINLTNFIVEPSDVHSHTIILKGDEAKHLVKTLRARKGDSFFAIDGTGKRYRAVIETASPKIVKGIISNVTRLEKEPYVDITLAMGICRPAKMDEVVEKSTELGVSSFLFYFSEKSYLHNYDENTAGRKITRLRKIARAAAKQSLRSVIPEIRDFVMFKDVIKLSIDYDIALVAESKSGSKSVDETLSPSADAKKILLLIGPESGLTDDEYETAVEYGFSPINLGIRRLRAETAGIIFPALVLNRLGDL
ncbi:MAG: 16S rRNA (uracil(1498)-N(3))-methyltransferase [Candidatus Zixiibacteriota bacterium]|nr:MAG: 16S rRNA (uracil(1498)-N(3))-methyltransferase [candidate division Zixibacteria bacterium]